MKNSLVPAFISPNRNHQIAGTIRTATQGLRRRSQSVRSIKTATTVRSGEGTVSRMKPGISAAAPTIRRLIRTPSGPRSGKRGPGPGV